ncbi:MAG: CotH kinase family protein [Sphingobacteriales bacterium]|nr:CotH kinase family protein [Sphingobacteriales bacterium]
MKNNPYNFFIVFTALCFLLPLCANSQIVINEGSNKNYSHLSDEYQQYPDWIELYNIGNEAINLGGYALTDDDEEPTKWILPDIILQPNEYKIIFCSGKNHYESPPFSEVVHQENFLPALGWNNHILNTPFYWDGTSNLIINTCSYAEGYVSNAVFNQSATPFYSTMYSFADGSPGICYTQNGGVAKLRPNIRINDIVIGEGTENNSTSTYPAPYGNWYWAAHHQLLVLAEELTAAGMSAGYIDSLAFDIVYTDPIEYQWFDVSMLQTQQASFSENYFFSLDGHTLHSNFKIDSKGEKIYLFSPEQTLVSVLDVEAEQYDISTGLVPDGSDSTTLLQPPTPGASNNTASRYEAYALPPTLSKTAGFYDDTFWIKLYPAQEEPDAQIYYTLNGSYPTPENAILYNGESIHIYQSCVLRARSFVSEKLPSHEAAASYLINVSHTTPILSVATDHSNLYGEKGIFDFYDMDWLRAAYVEYFDNSNTPIFSQAAGIKVDGGAGGSRAQPQHSFRVELANGVVGGDKVEYPLIPNRPNRSTYSDLYFRNGSNQYLLLPHKDAAQTEMMANSTHNYYSAWRPVSIYINGQYFGLYELREKFNEEMFKTLEDAKGSEIDILSLSFYNGGVLRAVSGSTEDFWNDYEEFLSLNTADTAYWEQADPYFDLQYYTDYIIAESWIGNIDWPQNNIKLYRSDQSDYRWRFCLIDLELSLQPNGWTDCNSDMVRYLLDQSPDNPYINIWKRSIENETYRHYFINRYADIMNTVYTAERLQTVENSMFEQTLLEMPNEFQRWGEGPLNLYSQMSNYYNNHLLFQQELACRSEQVRNHIQSNFELPRQVPLTLNVIPEGAGSIKISTLQPSEYPWQGIYFDGVPIKIEAVAKEGYFFKEWLYNDILATLSDSVFYGNLTADSLNFTAVFDLIMGDDTAQQQLVHHNNNDISIYPSIASEQIVLATKEAFPPHIPYHIINTQGEVVYTNYLRNGYNSIDIRALPTGIYAIQLQATADFMPSDTSLRFVKQ